MRIVDLIWSPEVIDKLAWKHGVAPEEVEEVIFGKPRCRKLQRGHVPGEDLYVAFGTTHAGRYLSVFFIHKVDRRGFVVSARDMDPKERRRFERESPS